MNQHTNPPNKPKVPLSATGENDGKTGNSSAFLIRPNRGAEKGLKAVKKDLKEAGCHWNTIAGAWSYPFGSKEKIEAILETSKISVKLEPFPDPYFNKTQAGREVENLWTRIDILEKKHMAEDAALLIETEALNREVLSRGLSPENPLLLQKREDLSKREEAQIGLAAEIAQLRNSAELVEKFENKEEMLPFCVLGHNSQKEILIWQNGRLIALPAGRLNKDELRLFIGGQSGWFEDAEGERRLKTKIIDEAHHKGFIDDESPLRAGVWFIKGKWVVISGNKAAMVDENGLQYLEEPIFEGKLVETNVSPWIDWGVFEQSLDLGTEGLKQVFNRLYEKVKLWNWIDPSMAAFATAFVLLSVVQQAMKWRPWVYLTGAKSTGKSTFFEFILQTVFGVLVERLDKSTAHATAQTIGNSGRIPVFDEFEKHRHIPDILELAKLFNKGGQKTSGTGADKAHRFHLHHMPWFGSIYLPKRLIQDAAQESRIIKLELKKLEKGTPLLKKFEAEEAPRIAAEIIACMIGSWDQIEIKAQEVNADRNLFIEELPGIEIRTVENFMYAASVLILVAPELADPIIPAWAAMQSEDDGEKLLDAILASIVRYDGEIHSVSEMLQFSKAGLDERYTKELERYGLRLTTHKAHQFLAIRCESVNRHLLKDTDYVALDIKGPLSRVEGAVGSAQVKMAGANQRCVLIPIERLGGLL